VQCQKRPWGLACERQPGDQPREKVGESPDVLDGGCEQLQASEHEVWSPDRRYRAGRVCSPAESLDSRIGRRVRYGGDEFLILLADTTIIGSEKVVDRINKHLAEWNIAGPSGRLPIACEYRGCRVARRREPRRGARCGRSENVREQNTTVWSSRHPYIG
jgi:hypothetical protein